MPGILEQSTKIALEELILRNSERSKFGLFISAEQLESLKEDLLALVLNSRNLRLAGEKFLGGGGQRETLPKPKGAVSRLPFKVHE